MTEYIDRQKIGLTDFEIIMCDGNYKEALKMLLDKIGKLPAEDVQPIVHGKWLKDYKMPTCSVCGNAVPFPDQYCSNCGSKMDLDIANYVDERGRENG